MASFESPSPMHGTGAIVTSHRPKVSTAPQRDPSPTYRRSLCPSPHRNPHEEGFYCPGGVRLLAEKLPGTHSSSPRRTASSLQPQSSPLDRLVHLHLHPRRAHVLSLALALLPTNPTTLTPLCLHHRVRDPLAQSKALPTSFCLF